MIDKLKKDECCGCTSCYNACPTSAITLRKDELGYLYPSIDEKKCVKCNLCEKVCPSLNKKADVKIKNAYIGRSVSSFVLDNSASGGIATALALNFVKRGAIVYGAVYNDKFEVVHSRIDKEEDIHKISGSKYIQSKIGDTFKNIELDLISGKDVLFIGTPCQVNGLNTFIRSNKENLYTIDFVCHGVCSPSIWSDYIHFIEHKNKSNIEKVDFRDKMIGYRSTGMGIEFKNGKKYFGSPRIDLMLKIFYSDKLSRDACYNCENKSTNRLSDLTLFDCWNPSDYLDIEDDNRGYTKILVNTENGQKIINYCKDIIVYQVNYKQILPKKAKNAYNSSIGRQEDRNDIIQEYIYKGFEICVDKFFKVSIFDNLVEKLKLLLNKVGVLAIFTKIKR
ncbi:Coenzyme F420 hydrogenase/dehydrogenase, beta subunit C-terminal domain [Amedibacillus dolichus]|nr:Coenzyme F420 hydrogenase/dehydrogenase, beta subunit C-terminal domain [Amedibacillus dolichus]